MAGKLTINVNGKEHEATATADTPLLYVLRNEMQLHGPRFGCGLAQCGACTVHLNGKAIRSCVTPVAGVVGQKVTTLEGLGTPEKPQQAPDRLHRGAGLAVRVLPERFPDDGRRAARAHRRAHRGADPPGARQPAVPLRDAHALHPRDQARSRGRVIAMTTISESPVTKRTFSRTDFLKLTGGGMLLVSFGVAPSVAKGVPAIAHAVTSWPDVDPRRLDSWIAVHPDNTVTVFHGKTDLGQGLETTFRQIVAEELDLKFKQVKSVVGDTAQSPHQGGASGSTGVTGGGPPVRNMAAEARRVLVEAASKKLGVPVGQLTVREGVVSTIGGTKITYGELLGGQLFNTTVQSNMSFGNGLTAQGVARPKNPVDHHIVGSSVPRIDIPDKVFGKYNFNVDARLPGMVHARVIRPTEAGSTVVKINGFKDGKPAGLVRVMPMGKYFVVVVAEREEQAIAASRALDVTWSTAGGRTVQHHSRALRLDPRPEAAEQLDLDEHRQCRHGDRERGEGRLGRVPVAAPVACRHGAGRRARELRPLDGHDHRLERHAEAAPGAERRLRPARDAEEPGARDLADRPGSDGRGDADDATLEAAWIARQIGVPVRLQWMRHEGIAWDPERARRRSSRCAAGSTPPAR